MEADQFARRTDQLARSVDNKRDVILRVMTMEVIRELIYSTPYRSGKAISNWQVIFGPEEGYVLPAYTPYGGVETNRQQAFDAAMEKIRTFRGGPGRSIRISNPVPYLTRLNAGSSTQAPAGFIETARLRGRNKARALLAKL